MKKALCLFLVFLCNVISAHGTQPLWRDAGGNIVPQELTSLIGKSITATPSDPVLGSESLAFDKFTSWHIVWEPQNEFGVKITNAPPVRQATHAAVDQQIQRMPQNLGVFKNDFGILCVNNEIGLSKGKGRYLATSIFCQDKTLTLVDLIKIPKNYALSTGSLYPRPNASEKESDDFYAFSKDKSFRILFSDLTQDFEKCVYAQKRTFSLKASKSQAYWFDEKLKKYQRVKLNVHVENFDPSCGADALVIQGQ